MLLKIFFFIFLLFNFVENYDRQQSFLMDKGYGDFREKKKLVRP